MKSSISGALLGLENVSAEFSSLLSKKGKKTQMKFMPLCNNMKLLQITMAMPKPQIFKGI